MLGIPFNVNLTKPAIAPAQLSDGPDPSRKSKDLKGSHEIASVLLRPDNSDSYAFSATLTDKGKIMQKGLSGEECLGKIDKKGNFSLKNGLTGNIFSSKTVLVRGYQDDTNPFALSLKEAEKQRAIDGSEVGLIHAALTEKGIDGRGVKIGVLDTHQKKEKEETWKESAHTKVVAGIMQDPQYGIAKGIQVEDLGENLETTREIKSDDKAALESVVIGNLCESYQKRSAQLQKILDRKDPSLRVLNNTQGSSRIEKYNFVWGVVNQKNDEGYIKFPKLRETILGKEMAGTSEQQYQAVVSYVDGMFDSSDALKASRRHYIEMTRKSSEAGIIIVCAAGNSHGQEKFPAQLKPGCEMDNFACSPYIITVAAADTNQKPGQRSEYKIADFSSQGDGQCWNPTIAAPGAEMPISIPVENLGHNLAVNGTSFSTPFTCGVIAMMLQRNPNLTFQEVKDKLQATAVPLKDYSKAEQGAGVLNAEVAILG